MGSGGGEDSSAMGSSPQVSGHVPQKAEEEEEEKRLRRYLQTQKCQHSWCSETYWKSVPQYYYVQRLCNAC